MSCKIQWDGELIQRYTINGPRYTSYPTAIQFREDFSQQDMHAAINRSNASARPLSLYFHIPFCNTVCYYCACNKVITANRRRAEPYLQQLMREIEIQGELFDNNREVIQLHWGGGTPTFLDSSEMTLLMHKTGKHFKLLNDDSGEYSIELDPRESTPDSIALLRGLGFNRISLGIQDFDPAVQKAVNRVQSEEMVRDVVKAIRDNEFHGLSMDLIYGLPLQTLETNRITLEKTIDLNPDRISLFNYAHLPQLFKVQKQIDESQLPTPETRLEILQQSIELLNNAGYQYIGMDHFARPEDPLCQAQNNGELQRNFQGYSTCGGTDMVAMGCSSISKVDNTYFQNSKNIETYQDHLAKGELAVERGYALTDEDRLRRHVVTELICHFTLDIGHVERRYGIAFAEHFAESIALLRGMEQDGLLEIRPERITVTDKGRLLIRTICMAFDSYNMSRLSEQVPSKDTIYSKVI